MDFGSPWKPRLDLVRTYDPSNAKRITRLYLLFILFFVLLGFSLFALFVGLTVPAARRSPDTTEKIFLIGFVVVLVFIIELVLYRLCSRLLKGAQKTAAGEERAKTLTVQDVFADTSAHAILNIVLVHGTWGRGIFIRTDKPRFGSPRWFNDSSPFRLRLEEELGKRNMIQQFECTSWSGSNSVFARSAAASRLRNRLNTSPEGVPQVVIGHSHGGNVVLRALKEFDTSRVKLNIVTLATPFLRVFNVPTPSHEFLFFSIWFPAMLAIFPTILAWESIPTAIVLSMLIAAALSVPLVQFLYNPGATILFPWKSWSRRPFALAEAANYDIVPNNVPFLVIRGVGDEASLTMAAGKIGARLNNVFAKYAWVMFLFVLFATIFAVTRPSLKNFEDELWVWQAALLMAFNLLPNCFNAVFGREFLVGAIRCEVSTDSVPDSSCAKVVTLRPNENGLRHLVYEDPQCVTAIIQWLEDNSVIAKVS
jgi:hypothetical protein